LFQFKKKKKKKSKKKSHNNHSGNEYDDSPRGAEVRERELSSIIRCVCPPQMLFGVRASH